ncbi:hypothetical protein ACPJHQ_19045 [Rossellomorea sp. H39__3]
MEQFKDANGLDVHFSYRRDAFSPESGHVLVICRYGEDWVFTRHKRGASNSPGKRKRVSPWRKRPYGRRMKKRGPSSRNRPSSGNTRCMATPRS